MIGKSGGSDIAVCTKSEAMTILGEVFERSGQVFGNRLVNGYLYGSYARDDWDDESDVDILLTVNGNDEDIRRSNSQMAKIDSDISLEHNVTVSVTVRSSEHFERYADVLPFYKNVISEGIRYAD